MNVRVPVSSCSHFWSLENGINKALELLKHVRDCGQEPCNSTGWHLIFITETSRVQILPPQLLNYIVFLKKKSCMRLCNCMSGKRAGNINVNCSVKEKAR